MDIQNRRDVIFALDIGTRSVIGLIAVPEGSLLRIIDMEYREHTQRAMVDGQIEDIDQAARICREVKEVLEDRNDIELSNVCVAAAGRALKTVTATAEMNWEQRHTITAQTVIEMENTAVDTAAAQLSADPAVGPVRCVGYSVVHSYLDDYQMSTLKDHKATNAKIEVIATFLPQEVVDSLYTTMRKIGLNITNLTLEPIAAMNAIIPEELRLLNIALVDIGAGTSDIAISDAGSIIAYTMATIAGDEITESIMQQFLVDFATAERMKREMSTNCSYIEYQSILGFEGKVTPDVLAEQISPAIARLAEEISLRILDANGKAPAAIFIVGGGSQTSTLSERMAECLEIDPSKIAVGRNNYMKSQVTSDSDVFGPQFATPVGIALTAIFNRKNSYTVTLNGEEVTVDSTIDTLMDLLSFKGYKHDQIMGRSGISIFFTIAGEKQFCRGGIPIAASIVVDGAVAGLTANLSDGAVIEFTPAQNGANAAPTVGEIVGRRHVGVVSLFGNPVHIGQTVSIDGTYVNDDYVIKDGDVLELLQITTLGDLCSAQGVDLLDMEVTVGGHLWDLSRPLINGDVIEAITHETPEEVIEDLEDEAEGVYSDNSEPEELDEADESDESETADCAVPALIYTEEGEPIFPIAVPECSPTSKEIPEVPLTLTLCGEPLNEEHVFEDDEPMAFEPVLLSNSMDTELTLCGEPLVGKLTYEETENSETADDAELSAPPAEVEALAEPTMPQPEVTTHLVKTEEGEEQDYSLTAAKINNPYLARMLANRAAHGMDISAAMKPSPIKQPLPPVVEEPVQPQPKRETELIFAPGLQPMTRRGLRQTDDENTDTEPQSHFRRSIKVTLNGEEKVLPPLPDGSSYMFLHMLNFVDIDPTKPKGDIVLLHNGSRASYVSPILNGDVIEIRWADVN